MTEHKIYVLEYGCYISKLKIYFLVLKDDCKHFARTSKEFKRHLAGDNLAPSTVRTSLKMTAEVTKRCCLLRLERESKIVHCFPEEYVYRK